MIEISRIRFKKKRTECFLSVSDAERLSGNAHATSRAVKSADRSGTSQVPYSCTEECLAHLRVPQVRYISHR